MSTINVTARQRSGGWELEIDEDNITQVRTLANASDQVIDYLTPSTPMSITAPGRSTSSPTWGSSPKGSPRANAQPHTQQISKSRLRGCPGRSFAISARAISASPMSLPSSRSLEGESASSTADDTTQLLSSRGSCPGGKTPESARTPAAELPLERVRPEPILVGCCRPGRRDRGLDVPAGVPDSRDPPVGTEEAAHAHLLGVRDDRAHCSLSGGSYQGDCHLAEAILAGLGNVRTLPGPAPAEVLVPVSERSRRNAGIRSPRGNRGVTRCRVLPACENQSQWTAMGLQPCPSTDS